MGYNKAKTKILLILLAFLSQSCMANLHEAQLTTALLNEPYSFQLYAEDESWDLFDDSYMIFSQTAGSLPNGVYVSSNGAITGTPTETGNFNFWVRAYAIDENFWEEDDITSDQEWYTLYVTERSTNSHCPAPNDETTTETFLCLGTIEQEELAENEEFDLDVNFFVNYQNGPDYAIDVLDFTIRYDNNFFAIDPDRLTSAILREAVTRVDSTAEFDWSQDGELRVIITASNNTIHKSGRVLDLPFYALTDIPANEYSFAILINEIHSSEDKSLPDEYEVDGTLTVHQDIENSQAADTQETLH